MLACQQYHNIMQKSECVVEKRFYSKKNNVYKVNCCNSELTGKNTFIIKEFLQSNSNIQNEINLLQHLKNSGLTVPGIYFSGKDYIIMEYIDGKTLLDIIEEREKKEPVIRIENYHSNADLINKLVKWMKGFYTHTRNIILNDINLRNFILDEDGSIYGLDFEDCGKGEAREDLGKLCAYILTYHPAFTPWKLKFTQEVFNSFVKEFELDPNSLLEEVEDQILKINKNRGEKFSIGKFEQIII